MKRKLYILLLAALLPVCAMSQSVNLNRGLVAYYPFEGNANDASGNHNDGRIEGATFSDGNFGQCSHFGGYDNSQIIRIPNSNSLKFSNAVSFAFWFTLDDYIGMDGYGRKGNYQHMKFFAKDFDRGQICAGINGIDENNFRVEICNDGKCCEATVRGNATKYWYHAAMVLTTSSMKIYINGKEVASKSVSMNFNNSNEKELILGRLASHWYPLHGCLDEFVVYNRVLSVSEIETLFKKGASDAPSAAEVAARNVQSQPTAPSTRTGRNAPPPVYGGVSEKISVTNNITLEFFMQSIGRVGFHVNFSDRSVQWDKVCVVLENGQKVCYKYDGHCNCYVCYLNVDDYNSDRLFVRSIVDDAGRSYSVNKEFLDYVAIKENYLYKMKGNKGGIVDAIAYLKQCQYDDHRAAIENEVVANKVKSVGDIVYVNDNYPALKDRLVDKMAQYVSTQEDVKSFMKYYSASNYVGVVDDKCFGTLNANSLVTDYDFYLNTFPNGKHVSGVKAMKAERQSYDKARNGTVADCATYLAKYPNGRYASEIRARKQRLEQLAVNSNKANWKMGNKICYCNTSGITMVTLDQWNEDKSSFKGIVVASPGGLYEGSILQKGNQLWIEPNGWHKCLDDEVSAALRNDRSAEAEKLLREKNMKFARGTIVSQTFTGGGIFHFTYTVKAKVDDWNDDFTRMKIQIVKTDGLERLDGESIWEGKYIWVSPIGWN